jgi:CheY-like chemotaxis protein
MNTSEILLVEDDIMDVLILRRVFKDVGVTNTLTHVASAPEALAYLNDPDRNEPCVILLDLDLPGMTGNEFLRTLRDGGTLDGIPVIILTGSDDPRDVHRSFTLGAAAYIVKSSDYTDFRRRIHQLRSYFNPAESN